MTDSSILHTGVGRVMVSLTPAELIELALATGDDAVAERLLIAAALLDQEAADDARKDRVRYR